MRKLCLVMGLICLAASAAAELQNVEIGGLMEWRWRMHRNTWNSPGMVEVRIPGALLPGRPIGWFAGGSPTNARRGVASMVDWDRRGNEWNFVEGTISLNLKADFTSNVAGFVELYDAHTWGEDFRSDHVTGRDRRAVTTDDVEFLQSYIEVRDLFDLPLRARIGRQTLHFGKGWLVAEKNTPTARQSFDAVRLTYERDAWTVDAWHAKLAEIGLAEEDGDVDFTGVHATYAGFDALSASLYWMWLRDARALEDTDYEWPAEWLENWLGLDDYDPSNLHTIGARLWGAAAGFDYDLELAYQTGNADAWGYYYKPLLYGDHRARFDNWAADLELGYTFDAPWAPRVMVGAAWFEGEDNRDLSFLEWLNPFHRPDASVSFNRLFGHVNYCPAFQDNAWMTNFKQIRTGVSFRPAEKISAMVRLQSVWVDEPFDWPVYFSVGRFRVPIAPALSFWTTPSDDHLGYSTCVLLSYQYSDDLAFRWYWGHLFAKQGAQDGSYVFFNGTDFAGGTAQDDADYMFFWATLKF